MDDMDAPVSQGRSGLIVGILVIVGIGLLGVGVFLVVNKRNSAAPEAKQASGDISAWCKLRQEWKRKATPLDGDIMVKGAVNPDSPAAKQLRTKRNSLCHDYARKLRELLKADPALFTRVQAVETALIKEGKTRSNISVKIANRINADLPKAGTTEQLEKIRKALAVTLVAEINKKKAEYDGEVKKGMGALGSSCIGIYHGTMTDAGTSGNPYTTWEELEVVRTVAVRAVTDKIKELEPTEEFYNRVRHDLMARHRKDLLRCYKATKKKNPRIPTTMGLKIRLTKKGGVKGLNFAWDNGMDERILDCLVNNAAKWKLPKANDEFDEANISIDFSKL